MYKQDSLTKLSIFHVMEPSVSWVLGGSYIVRVSSQIHLHTVSCKLHLQILLLRMSLRIHYSVKYIAYMPWGNVNHFAVGYYKMSSLMG